MGGVVAAGARFGALLARMKVECDAVQAIALTGGPRAVVEHVSEVRVAAFARHRGALQAEAVVAALHDVQTRYRLPEARPAGAGVEFGP